MTRLLLAALLGSVVITGCAGSDAGTRTYLGQVTDVNAQTVCIGASEANGECFAKDSVAEGLRVGDCVSVTYATDPSEPGPFRAEQVSSADADSHPSECPGTPSRAAP